MAIGFAAFSQQLQINSTSEVTSTWDVHIKDNGVSYKNAVAATSNLAEKTSNLVATFACTLTTPGTSTISYDVIVENKGTLNAKLDSIELTGGNSAISVVTSPTNASLATSPIVLGPDDETTITVIVSYNDILTQPTGDGAVTNITAHLNFSQTADEPTQPGYTGLIYRKSSQQTLNNSTYIEPVTGNKWIVYLNGTEDPSLSVYVYDNHQDCTNMLSGVGITEGVEVGGVTYTCQQKNGTFGGISYTTSQAEIQTNNSYYLKHDVVDGKITQSYSCFVISGNEYCMQSSYDGSTYQSNYNMLSGLNTAGTITCSHLDNSYALCSGGNIGYIYANSTGNVFSGTASNSSCSVYNYAIASCN